MLQYHTIDFRADHAGFVSQPHSHDFYEVFFFQHGDARHYIDFQEYPIKDGALFLIAAQQVHYITADPGTHNQGCVLFLEAPVIDLLAPHLRSLFTALVRQPAFYLTDPFVTQLFLQIGQEHKTQAPKASEVVLHLLSVALMHVWRQKPAAAAASTPYLEFVALLEAQYARLHSVAAYAELLATTPDQLNRLCKAHGKTALQTIHDRINLEARRLLFFSENQVKEICFTLGFEDAAHFNHFFKRMNNQTPLQFRAQAVEIFHR